MKTSDKRGLYDQRGDLPETLTGEILIGQLHAQPRPAPKHLHATSRLDRTIGRGYGDGDGGPGGWWILIEPEIHFVRDIEVAVPGLEPVDPAPSLTPRSSGYRKYLSDCFRSATHRRHSRCV